MKCLSFQKKTRFKWKKLNTKYRKLLQSWLQKKIFIKGDSQGNANSSAVCLTLRCRNGMDGFTDRLSLYRLGRKGCGDAVTSLRLRLGSRDAALLVKSADMRMPVRERWQYMCSAALEPLEKKHGGSRSSWNQLLPSTNGSVPRDCDLITFTLLSSPWGWVNT